MSQVEGPGAQDGVVLPLHVVGSSVYDIAYTIDATVGAAGQTLSLQVDTGSSDLWIASKSCSSSSCSKTSGHLYDPSSSTQTGKDFTIRYLQGNVSGPIVWDKFDIGGYSLDFQALAAADDIDSEPLGPNFSGVLGLALPLNSIIAEQIPPVTSNNPDGAAWASNLFSITPVSSAPSARFISLLLSRPGSDTVPAQLGIGRHPNFVTNPSTVQYAALESEREGTLFWKVDVRAITVWVNGEPRPVQIGSSSTGATFPSAVLDSGVPLILTTSAVANGIYGAIGVGPANDGNYYVPCTTPLNLTITLDDRTPILLHPLDLTTPPSNDNTASFCTGVIQSYDSVLTRPDAPADIILGVPFLRNAYTVMAYEPPNESGTFDTTTTTTNSSGAGNIKPRLGLVGITDPTKALQEFQTVRVFNKPLSSSSNPSPGSEPANNGGGVTVGRHLSVGVIVLVALIGFFALCLGLFGVRWWLTRRRFQRASDTSAAGSAAVLAGVRRETEKEGGYAYARASTIGSGEGGKVMPGKELYVDEETMRSVRWEPYMQDHGLVDLRLGEPEPEPERDRDLEMGVRPRQGQGEHDAWGDADDTLVVGRPEVVRAHAHERSMSTGVPLLHEIKLERAHAQLYDEFGVRPRSGAFDEEGGGGGGPGDRTSMAGVGTAARSARIGSWRHSEGGSHG